MNGLGRDRRMADSGNSWQVRPQLYTIMNVCGKSKKWSEKPKQMPSSPASRSLMPPGRCLPKRQPTTIDNIAAAAGVTCGAVYWHFANKGSPVSRHARRVTLPLLDWLGGSLLRRTMPTRRHRIAHLWPVRRLQHDPVARQVYEIMILKCEYEEFAHELANQQAYCSEIVGSLAHAYRRPPGWGNCAPASTPIWWRWTLHIHFRADQGLAGGCRQYAGSARIAGLIHSHRRCAATDFSLPAAPPGRPIRFLSARSLSCQSTANGLPLIAGAFSAVGRHRRTDLLSSGFRRQQVCPRVAELGATGGSRPACHRQLESIRQARHWPAGDAGCRRLCRTVGRQLHPAARQGWPPFAAPIRVGPHPAGHPGPVAQIPPQELFACLAKAGVPPPANSKH